MVAGVPTAGGLHCESTALGVLLSHAGLALSEPMIFGLGAGLSFIYWDSKQQALPFLGGRVKPFAFTEALAERLGLDLRVQETTSAKKAWNQVRDPIDRGIPVGLQLDCFYLEYFSAPVHFAGHLVALHGYDEERAYLIDTAQQGGAVSTSLQSLARAWAARGPMSARHRSFTVGPPTRPVPDPDGLGPAIRSAIATCAEEFLAPPIANLGNRGIRTAAKRILTWFERVEEPQRDLATIAMIMERAGTGGALFRNSIGISWPSWPRFLVVSPPPAPARAPTRRSSSKGASTSPSPPNSGPNSPGSSSAPVRRGTVRRSPKPVGCSIGSRTWRLRR